MALTFSWFVCIGDPNHRDLSIVSSVVLRQILSEKNEEICNHLMQHQFYNLRQLHYPVQVDQGVPLLPPSLLLPRPPPTSLRPRLEVVHGECMIV